MQGLDPQRGAEPRPSALGVQSYPMDQQGSPPYLIRGPVLYDAVNAPKAGPCLLHLCIPGPQQHAQPLSGIIFVLN